MNAEPMLSRDKLPFLLSLVLLFLLWKEGQGRCSSCPSNGCSQSGMSQGKCYSARYYTTSYQSTYYVTTYYIGTSKGSATYKCGFWNRKRCTRYHTSYHQRSTSSPKYRTQYRSNIDCDAYCCPRHRQESDGSCTVDCGIPSSLSNGQRRYSSTTVGNRVNYTCNTGYSRTAGSSSRTCQPNHQWSGTHPTCTPVNCGTPRSLSNGQRHYTSTTVGYTVTYTCNSGYLRTAGSSSRTCHSNGLWSGSHPTCTPVNCGTPVSLSNGQTSYSSTTFGYTVTYTCNTGYLMTAGSSCQSTGQWSGTHPTCTRSCGTPSSLSNGQRSYTSTTVGNRVTYTCNTGYLRTAGSSSRTCQPNGVWSGTHPTCTHVNCGTPRSLSNGQRRYSSTSFGSKVTYACNTGYRMTAGSSSGTCQSNGVWSGSHPTCTRNSNGNIQLIGGTTAQQGRVEIWYNSRWNTICDDYWDINDAHVVCRQLGYREAVSAHQSAHFGEGSGQILLDDLQCTGREASLLECSHGGINNHNCGHGEDASLTCMPSRFSSGFLRLANGYARSAGRVEIWYSDQWNTVCDDSWSITDAKVACRQLGYEGAALAHQGAHFGQGSGGILLDNLSCTGTEGSLFQCQHNGIYSHNCGHGEDAGVTCGCGDPGTNNGTTPIVNGTAVNSTVTYTCQSGYILSGNSTRTCHTNGHWTGSVPTCIRQCS